MSNTNYNFESDDDGINYVEITKWAQFGDVIDRYTSRNDPSTKKIWVFRGQPRDEKLATNLERALDRIGKGISNAPDMERRIIREFRRHYDGRDKQLVLDDTCYAMSVMEHYGAPTRLLDVTYSPYIAVFFALENGFYREADLPPVVWCMDLFWLNNPTNVSGATNDFGELIKTRDDSDPRDDSSFLPLYMRPNFPSKFVHGENPYCLNERLIIQQGNFLCPADVSSPFMDNLKAHDGLSKSENLFKVILKLEKDEWEKAIYDLIRMNISRRTLFPGIVGFCKSLCNRMVFLRPIESSSPTT